MTQQIANHKLFSLARSNAVLLNAWSEIENFFFKKKLAADINKPVFICGLARSGTTILTHIVNDHEDTGSMLYKDLPFIEIPLIWNKLNALYYGTQESQERIHGDGLEVNPDSPDAFEELLWKKHIENYDKNGFSTELDISYINNSFEKEHKSCINKILHVRGGKKRYVAKGNYNLLRIPYIQKLYPDAKFIIAIREPVSHCSSLVRVHKKFIELHKKNPDLGKQLSLLGHFEFGPNRKPIHSPVESDVQKLWDEGKDFEGYILQWNELYSRMWEKHKSNSNVVWVTHENMINNPEKEIKRLLNYCELPAEKISITKNVASIAQKNSYDSNEKYEDADAQKLYQEIISTITL